MKSLLELIKYPFPIDGYIPQGTKLEVGWIVSFWDNTRQFKHVITAKTKSDKMICYNRNDKCYGVLNETISYDEFKFHGIQPVDDLIEGALEWAVKRRF